MPLATAPEEHGNCHRLPQPMMTSSNGSIFGITGPLCGISPVTSEFPFQKPVTRRFVAFFYQRLNKQLSKQSWGRWFETPPCPIWHHCNANPIQGIKKYINWRLLCCNRDLLSAKYVYQPTTTTAHERCGIWYPKQVDCYFKWLQRTKETSQLCITGVVWENPPLTGRNCPRKCPIEWKVFPYHDVTMHTQTTGTHSWGAPLLHQCCCNRQ